MRSPRLILAALLVAGVPFAPVASYAKDGDDKKDHQQPAKEDKADKKDKEERGQADQSSRPARDPEPTPAAEPAATAEPTAEPASGDEAKGSDKDDKRTKHRTVTTTPAVSSTPQATPTAAAPRAWTPAATPAPATSAPATSAPVATPAASAAPSREPARRDAPERGAIGRPAVAAGSVARRTEPSRPAAVVAPATTAAVVRTAARTPARTRAATPRRTPRPASSQPALRTLTRTATRVIEVVPRPVRLALGGLLALALGLACALAAASLRARRLERQRRRLVEDVGLLQSALLPELDERVGPAAVSAAYRPAEGLAAGGDFYDAFPLDEHRTCVIVGDVAGHGREAVPVTALVRYTLRAYLEAGLAPRQALQVAARVLDPQLRDALVTVVLGVYDVRTGLLTYAAAGHPPPVVLGDEVQPVLAFSSPAFGLGAQTGRRQVTVPLPPGTAACFYTDGLAEVRVGDGRFGLDRLADEFRSLGESGDARHLVARVLGRGQGQTDDVVACILRPPTDGPPRCGGRTEEIEVDLDDVRNGRLGRFLTAYGVSKDMAADAVASALDVARRAHAAIVEVYHDDAGTIVTVDTTPTVAALPLRRDTAEPMCTAV